MGTLPSIYKNDVEEPGLMLEAVTPEPEQLMGKAQGSKAVSI